MGNRGWLLLLTFGIGWTAFAAQSRAQDWPTRPVTMVVPAAAGSNLDIVGRILTPGLSNALRQQVIVENMGGAGGMIGAHRVAKAAPDGYQFVLGSAGTHAVSQSLYRKPLYNPMTDFTPVGLVAEQSIVLVARKDLPASNLQQLIVYTKAHQATMQFGSAGLGSTVHLACALLNAAMGVEVAHIPYRGGAPAMQDLIAGRLDYQCVVTTLAIPYVKSGQVTAIAILSRARSPILPGLASAEEQGLAGFETTTWNAIFLPRDAPAPIIQRLNEAIGATINNSGARRRLQEVATDVVAPERRSPEHLTAFVKNEIEKWRASIRAAGLAPRDGD